MLCSKNIIISFQSRPSCPDTGKETLCSRKVVKKINCVSIKMLTRVPLSCSALPEPHSPCLPTPAPPPTSTLHVLVLQGRTTKRREALETPWALCCPWATRWLPYLFISFLVLEKEGERPLDIQSGGLVCLFVSPGDYEELIRKVWSLLERP